MAHKKVSGLSTGALIGIVGGGALLIYLATRNQAPPTPRVVTVPQPSSSNATATAAEITAGAAVITTAFNDLFGNN
jgi:hypothetical protein